MVKVLSLFDGMSCGMVAFERAGIPVEEYHACEIDKYAIQISQKNYPWIVRHGSVVDYHPDRHFDYLIGGSPCQGFSFAGKQLAFNDPRSKLFFEYVRILKECRAINPNIKFLLENVKMKKEHLAVITQLLGVEPVFINSALVSAQNRQRYYWANWSFGQPADRGIFLKDIVETGEVDREKSYCIDSNYYKGRSVKNYMEKARRQIENNLPSKIMNVNPSGKGMNGWIYDIDAKAPTVTTNKGEGNKIDFRQSEKRLMVAEYSERCRAQIKKNTKSLEDKALALSTNANMTGSGVTILAGQFQPQPRNYKELGLPRNEGLEFRKGGKANSILANSTEKNLLSTDTITYRKLTVLECERLQTMPEGYTEGVSNTQRYKMLGNGWTIEVIAHILRGSE